MSGLGACANACDGNIVNTQTARISPAMRELSANEAIGVVTFWMREGIRASTNTDAGCGGLWEGGWSIATTLAGARLFGAATVIEVRGEATVAGGAR